MQIYSIVIWCHIDHSIFLKKDITGTIKHHQTRAISLALQ